MAYDIAIVGGGMVGQALACALAKQTSLSVVILEAQSAPQSSRVSAISLASKRILQSLGVWNAIKSKGISSFEGIHVWDDASKGKITFDANAIAEPYLGFIIENNVIQTSLEIRLKQFPTITLIRPIKLTKLADHDVLSQAKLIIAADGANSWLRQEIGIELDRHDYEQSAIVATVTTTLPHQKIARQVFLATGPLAFLPLAEPNTSSIVWSLSPLEAMRLMTMSDIEFCLELKNAFSSHLGEITTVGRRHQFSLARQQAKSYVKSRVALVGDAAHTIHPLAGQGVNMGLLDAASLAEVIAEAVTQHRDFSSLSTLRRYERWRRADNAAMMQGVHALKHLFASSESSIHAVRGMGLTMTNNVQWIKNIFTRHAVGNRSGLPRLAQFKS